MTDVVLHGSDEQWVKVRRATSWSFDRPVAANIVVHMDDVHQFGITLSFEETHEVAVAMAAGEALSIRSREGYGGRRGLHIMPGPETISVAITGDLKPARVSKVRVCLPKECAAEIARCCFEALLHLD